jgi:hypothetical protein
MSSDLVRHKKTAHQSRVYVYQAEQGMNECLTQALLGITSRSTSFDQATPGDRSHIVLRRNWCTASMQPEVAGAAPYLGPVVVVVRALHVGVAEAPGEGHEGPGIGAYLAMGRLELIMLI